MRGRRRNDGLGRHAQHSGDLARRRRATFGSGELRLGSVDDASPLDDALRQPDDSRRLRHGVADRAPDPETSEPVEVDAARGIKRLDRVEQPDASFLHEVVEGDVQPAVTLRHRPDGRQMLLDETLTGAAIASRVFE